jgi:predicted HAD superfamily Cof-like phosphohydrolase
MELPFMEHFEFNNQISVSNLAKKLRKFNFNYDHSLSDNYLVQYYYTDSNFREFVKSEMKNAITLNKYLILHAMNPFIINKKINISSDDIFNIIMNYYCILYDHNGIEHIDCWDIMNNEIHITDTNPRCDIMEMLETYEEEKTNIQGDKMFLTNYEKVMEFMNSFNQQTHETFQPQLIQDKSLTNLRLALIDEEVKELHEAVQKNDFVEVIDALSDILYVTYGAGLSYGINLDQSFSIVHDSNMTKLCKTEEEAQSTIEWYKENEKRYDSPAYKKSNDGKYWIVFNESTGKVLKSIMYKPANFQSMFNQTSLNNISTN